MYKIKHKPEYFIVKEISNVKLMDKGEFAVFLLKKTNYNTIDVIKRIANFLKIKQRQIGYGGNKDKVAITEQYISVPNRLKDKLNKFELKDVELKFVGYTNESLFLGDLIGNKFEIVISDLSEDKVNQFIAKYGEQDKIKIINYFGEQRFSRNNSDIGKALVKGNFKLALELIGDTNNGLSKEFKSYLDKNKNDYVGALKLVPDKLLKLFVHAYQSFMWNYVVKIFIDDNVVSKLKNINIPLLGFGSEIHDELNTIYSEIMSKESISQRDFIIKALPHLSQEGAERDLFVFAEDFKILEQANEKIKVCFKLKKGSYATEVVRQVLE